MALAPFGCKSNPDATASTVAVSSAQPSKQAQASVRNQFTAARLLLDEVHRAELDVGGLFIDLGTGDQHKYLQGGWANGWGRRGSDADGSSYTQARARSVPLRVFLQPDAGPIRVAALRLRTGSAPGQVTLLADGKPLGSARVGTNWTTVTLPVAPERLPAGWRQLSILFPEGKSAVRRDVDWLWLGRASGEPLPTPAARSGPLALGARTRRALLAPSSRRYAFHLVIPPEAKLIFDRGAERSDRFLVRAQVDGAAPRVLFDGRAEAGRWLETVVDLKGLGGKAVRLELATEGQGPAGWGEPEIVVPGGHADTQQTPPWSEKPGGPAKNLILLVIDTVRADVFKAFDSKSRVHTPALDRLAQNAVVFQQAYSNENWTKPAVATVLSGLYPSTHGAKRESDVLSKQVSLLPEKLKDQGFSTAAFVANGYVSDKFGFKRGWDTYRNYIRENRPSEAEHVYADALAWVQRTVKGPARGKSNGEGDRRFFLYLQTIDPHVTYAAPEEFVRRYHPEPYHGPLGSSLDGLEQAAITKGRKKLTAADQRWIRALYDAEVSYHDAHMGRFVQALSGLGILEDTLLVVTNDHGEEIGDHGRYGHGHSLYDELIRAPMLLHYPARLPPRQVADVVENVDLLPTITELLGVPPLPGLDGISLLPALAGRPASVPAYAVSEFLDAHRALRVDRFKLLAGAGGFRRLFDLKADPGESNDLSASAPIARRLCEQYLAEALATPAKAARTRDMLASPRRFKAGTVKADPELRRQLEALGYFGGLK